MNLNIMLDPKPLYPKMYHFIFDQRTPDLRGTAKHYTRTTHPTRYYFIDFGISRKYPPGEDHPLEDPIFGGDKSVPSEGRGYGQTPGSGVRV